MNNDKGLLSGSITILIGAVIAIMALVRGPWQAWLLIGVFTLWGLWVVLILLLPYMEQARRRRKRQQRERQLHAEGVSQPTFQIPELEEPIPDELLLRYANHRILGYLHSLYADAYFEWCEKSPVELIRSRKAGRAASDNGHLLARAHLGGIGSCKAFLVSIFNDRILIFLGGDRVPVQAAGTGSLA